MILKKLNGHSGCEVCLVQEHGDIFVRKKSTNMDYNKRLQAQMNKQILFKNVTIKAPKVYNWFYDQGYFCFDMEFIRGDTFSDYIDKHTTGDIIDKFRKISSFVFCNNELNENIELEVNRKINTIEIDNKYKPFLDYCRQYNWEKIKKSYCHGDLTFENIIISGDDIYILDFLDSFVDSWVIDLSKIFQDLYVCWSWRNKSKTPFTKLVMLTEFLIQENSTIPMEAINRMLLLNLLRILPYTNQATRPVVEKRIKFLYFEVLNA